MENSIYLLNMTVSGIKNIKKEVRIDFYKKTIDKNFNPQKYRIKAIYGENGSGKSAIITAVKIFQDLMINDNYLVESKTQDFLNEIINKLTLKFCFSCEFLADFKTSKSVYHYSVEIGRNDKGLYEIQAESLKVKNGCYANNNYNLVFECKKGELSYINASDTEKELIVRKTLNLLSFHSFISIYLTALSPDYVSNKEADQNLAIHITQCSALSLSIKVYLAEEDQHESYFMRKRMQENRLLDLAQRKRLYAHYIMLFYSNVNEKNVAKRHFNYYKEKIEKLSRFIRIFKPELVSIDIDTKENRDQYECELNLNYGSYSINREFESTGIKKLIRLFDCFVAASTIGIVFIDEMDSNLNDIYLCKLIEYFMYYGKGQLCFTTHNLGPMNMLKKYKNSIDFLSSDNHIVPWTSRGNASPENCYRNGMIEDSPFNIDATDFIGILEE